MPHDTALIPGWDVWQSVACRQWHARKLGSSPPLLIHDNSLEELRDQARYW